MAVMFTLQGYPMQFHWEDLWKKVSELAAFGLFIENQKSCKESRKTWLKVLKAIRLMVFVTQMISEKLPENGIVHCYVYTNDT